MHPPPSKQDRLKVRSGLVPRPTPGTPRGSPYQGKQNEPIYSTHRCYRRSYDCRYSSSGIAAMLAETAGTQAEQLSNFYTSAQAHRSLISRRVKLDMGVIARLLQY